MLTYVTLDVHFPTRGISFLAHLFVVFPDGITTFADALIQPSVISIFVLMGNMDKHLHVVMAVPPLI